MSAEPLSEQELREIGRAAARWLHPDNGTYSYARQDIPRLIAEIRRLRGMFSEADAKHLHELAFAIDVAVTARDLLILLQAADPEPLRDLAARIRSAINIEESA